MRFRPGFTVTGFAVFVICMVMLIYSLYIRNAYEIFVSAIVLFIWMLLFIAGIFGKRRLAAMEVQWKTPMPLRAASEEKTLITGLMIKVPWFFRLHSVVKGSFFPSGLQKEFSVKKPRGCPVLAETAVPKKNDSVELDLAFPMSGVFKGKCIVYLKDIFGFFSFQCGVSMQRTLNVISRPCEKKSYFIEPLSGAEDQKNKNADDEERYYMREYAPGDRLRDINWKSSERIDTLITRISPDTHEKICRLEVFFRNYGPLEPSLDDLWLLDRAKASLSQFLKTLKEINDKYIFILHTAEDTRELPDMESLEFFLEELAGIPFSPIRQEYPDLEKGGLYIFSTACDLGLSSFLSSCQARDISLFITQPALKNKKNKDSEILFIRDFFKKGFIPLPKWLISRKNKKQLIIDSSRLKGLLDISYTEVRL